MTANPIAVWYELGSLHAQTTNRGERWTEIDSDDRHLNK
jgi:hypothetical protein